MCFHFKNYCGNQLNSLRNLVVHLEKNNIDKEFKEGQFFFIIYLQLN